MSVEWYILTKERERERERERGGGGGREGEKTCDTESWLARFGESQSC